MAGDTLGIPERLDIRRIVNDLPRLAVTTVFGQIARLRLRHARSAGQRQRQSGLHTGRHTLVRLTVTAGAGTHLAGGIVHIGALALDFAEILVKSLEENAAVGRHHKMR